MKQFVPLFPAKCFVGVVAQPQNPVNISTVKTVDWLTPSRKITKIYPPSKKQESHIKSTSRHCSGDLFLRRKTTKTRRNHVNQQPITHPTVVFRIPIYTYQNDPFLVGSGQTRRKYPFTGEIRLLLHKIRPKHPFPVVPSNKSGHPCSKFAGKPPNPTPVST